MAGSAAASTKGAPRRGSSFSDKQIAHAVKDGRAVEVLFCDGSTAIGFVYGADDFHWGLVTLDGRRLLVHKSTPRLVFTEHLLEHQGGSVRERIEPLVSGFRDYVLREVFNQTEPAPVAARS